MKKALVAGALALSLALPAGWATAKSGVPAAATPKAPRAQPRVSVGRVHKSVKVGKTTARARTRRSSAGANSRKVRSGRPRTPATGGGVGLSNPMVGRLTVGMRQRPNGHSRIRVGGNARGTPLRAGTGL
jgi:hypothetical protein